MSLKFAGFVGAAALLTLCGGTALAKTEMNFQTLYQPGQVQYKEIMEPWAADITRATNGEVVIHVFANRSLTKDTISSIKNGSLEIGGYSPSTFSKRFPYGSLIALPGLLKDARHGVRFSYALYDKSPEFKKEIDSVGVPLALCTSTDLAFSSVHDPIRSPEDLKGKKVLVITPSFTTILKAMGAIPIQVNSGDVYIGLQRGMADAFYGALPFQEGLKVMEVVKYLTPVPLTLAPNVIAMNRDVFDKLTGEQQDYILKASGKVFAEKLANSLHEEAIKAKDAFRAAGVEVIELTPDQQAAFDRIATSTLPDWEETKVKGNVKEVIRMYYDLAKEVEAE